MHEYEFDNGLSAGKKEKKKKIDSIETARDFASSMAEKETNEKLRGKKDDEAWKRMYWSLFEKFYWQKQEEIEK